MIKTNATKDSNTHQSPILYKDTLSSYCHRGTSWVCLDRLRKAFELPATMPNKIQFYSQSEPDGRYTTLVRMPKTSTRNYDITQPVRANLFMVFRWWLRDQINSGRPYIGLVYWE